MQVYGRVVHRLVRPQPSRAAAPPLRAVTSGAWAQAAARPMSLVGPDTFLLLGERHALADRGWDDESLPKLWRYNLHYFDHLAADDTSREARAWQESVLARWVAENPPVRGTGWESYPTSLRIVNWVKWALAGNALPDECVHSLAVQARWLARRLEVHLLGNHLFANAKALVFAGCYFRGPEAAAWLAAGMRILEREVPEQVLADGGQFELSPMYHALALEDMLDLVNVTAAFDGSLPGEVRAQAAGWRSAVPPMLRWLDAMCHPDGGISFFNDAAFGVAPALRELRAYARRLGIGEHAAVTDGITSLEASGYVRWQSPGAVAILDAGRVGPDYLPGHAHADTLSFELSVHGERVLVNSGTSEYGTGPERLRQRGTAAHNTVVVDGADSSEVWSGFRVARRARVHGLSIEAAADATSGGTVKAAHDGYRRLAGRPVHRRQWTMDAASITITDVIDGTFNSAAAHYHVHPDVRVLDDEPSPSGGAAFTLALAGGQRVLFAVERGELRMTRSTWHPGFGQSLPTRCIVVAPLGREMRVRVSWGDET